MPHLFAQIDAPTLAFSGVIGGAILGAAINQIGTYFNNKAAQKRLETELNSRAENEREKREFEIKRTAMQGYVESVGPAIGYIVQIPTLPPDKLIPPEPILEYSKHLSRLTLVAPPLIIKPITEASKILITTFLETIESRQQIDRISTQIDEAQNGLNLRVERTQEIRFRIAQMVDSPNPNLDAVQNLARLSQEATDEGNAVNGQIQELSATRQRRQLEAMRSVLTRFEPLKKLQQDTLSAIRTELGIPAEAAWMATIGDIFSDALKLQVEKFTARAIENAQSEEGRS